MRGMGGFPYRHCAWPATLRRSRSFDVGPSIIKEHDVSRGGSERPGKSFIDRSIRFEGTQQMGGVGKVNMAEDRPPLHFVPMAGTGVGQTCGGVAGGFQIHQERCRPLHLTLDPTVMGRRHFFC